jgi:type VI secretion system protein ImpE
MNEAKIALDTNRLNDAIQAATNIVKSKPTDVTARTSLFELLVFAGELERAEKQLDVVGQQDANAMIGAQIYRQCINAERQRSQVFGEGMRPKFLTPPPAYIEKLIQANNLLRESKLAEARELLDEAETERPAFSGKLNGEIAFQDFRDYNDLTSSFLEIIVKENYFWLPLEQVKKITITKAESLRDLYWTQAKIEARDGTEGEIFLSGLYYGSTTHEDDVIRLGRATDWADIGEEIFLGEGARMFWYDGNNQPLVEITELEFD